MNMEQNNEIVLNEHNKEEHRPSHTAEHLLNQVMVRMFGCERSKNAHIERKKSKINYTLKVQPTAEQVAEIEAKMRGHIRSVNQMFEEERKNLGIRFRGSDNQRIILVKESLEKGEVVDSLGSGRQEMLENIMNDIMFSL